MTLLPSPIPHPLDYSPWELPGWVYEALDWVIGVEWPEGDEKAVWDLADQWYAVADALAGPRADAVAAAGEVRSGYGGVGAVAEAFDAAWKRVAEGDEAPLPVLLAVSGDLGRLVEGCGCDIEGAKLEVWIELGILVVELLSLAVAAVLTAGAASPAAGAAIAASRFVVQQIFKKLLAQLARKTLKQGLKEAGERAAKRVAEGGMRGLARKAARGGLEEAAEESGITLATQAYQNSTGRRHGLDVTDAGMSALGGLAGGAAAPLAGLGRHATGRAARVGEHFGREMTGEVIADQAANVATGQGLVSLEDAARAAASGATGSTTAQTDTALHHRLDGRMAALAGGVLRPDRPRRARTGPDRCDARPDPDRRHPRRRPGTSHRPAAARRGGFRPRRPDARGGRAGARPGRGGRRRAADAPAGVPARDTRVTARRRPLRRPGRRRPSRPRVDRVGGGADGAGGAVPGHPRRDRRAGGPPRDGRPDAVLRRPGRARAARHAGSRAAAPVRRHRPRRRRCHRPRRFRRRHRHRRRRARGAGDAPPAGPGERHRRAAPGGLGGPAGGRRGRGGRGQAARPRPRRPVPAPAPAPATPLSAAALVGSAVAVRGPSRSAAAQVARVAGQAAGRTRGVRPASLPGPLPPAARPARGQPAIRRLSGATFPV
ncbi:hypothetical protein O7628_18455 [Micromonospora sp. WMMD956]|uniref:WXG100-like domain-containing protein n=1 Tax=Micromonospora sp. WMMD956 TaxID=3016108 RepID=UPI00241686CB|nr:hypothetical protein [Micromonospora sp. WMMD956]MDG4817477.1 hypothetical protein [Micromonospora sp. WMMD956]